MADKSAGANAIQYVLHHSQETGAYLLLILPGVAKIVGCPAKYSENFFSNWSIITNV